jgi:excisionase family DNA binding protein
MALISTTEAARRLNASPDTIKRLCQQGRIPASKPGRDWMIEESELPKIVIAPRGWPKGKPRRVR